MKWKPSAFLDDEVELSLWDVLRLLVGRRVSDSACGVRLRWWA